MKRLIFLFALLFTASSSFMSCRDNERRTDDAQIIEEDVTTTPGTDNAMDDDFGTYDANRDDQWDENEFSEAYQGDFSGYDADTSGDLNNEEFSQATFRNTDRNQDNTITRDEWDAGYDNFGDYANQEDYDQFDTDQSGDLSAAEWNEGFRQSDWFTTTDTDRNEAISSQEWTSANFSRWDQNGDGVLDRQEFQTYNRVMRNSGNDAGSNNTNTNNTDTNNNMNNN